MKAAIKPGLKYLSLRMRRFDELNLSQWITASLALHCLLYGLSKWSWKPSLVALDDTPLDVDVLMDAASSHQSTALPNAKITPKEAVPSNILPQLPKNYTVDTTKPDDAAMRDPAQEKAKEANDAKKDVTLLKNSKENEQKIDKEDFLKRLAVEKLRNEEKKSDQYQAPNKDAIARLKAELEKTNLGKAGYVGGGAGSGSNRYKAILKAAIQRNWNLPETFKLSQSKPRTVVQMRIRKSGELGELKIIESSGNDVFDRAAIQAVQASVPLPVPEDKFIDQPFLYSFTP